MLARLLRASISTERMAAQTVAVVRRGTASVAEASPTKSRIRRKWLWACVGGVAIVSVVGAASTDYIDWNDLTDYFAPAPVERQKLVILGTGWGATTILRHIDPKLYDITVVSPRNFFLFTPLLPSVSVGTLDIQTISVPMRRFLPGDAKYLRAICVDIDPSSKQIVCESKTADGTVANTFSLPYDKLVVAVGAINNTFGTPGVTQHCFFLKEAEDAERIRRAILEKFEAASTPGLPAEERRRLLHFVVVGGGPTGVEFAAELNGTRPDFVSEELVHLFPQLKPDVRITLIQSQDHILNTYDKAVGEYTEKHFAREGIHVVCGRYVVAVSPGELLVRHRRQMSSEERLPFGLCVWSTGISPPPLVGKFIAKLPSELQPNKRLITTDACLRVMGAPDVYALGDCATISQSKLIDRLVELFGEADTNKDGSLSLAEFMALVARNRHRYPQLDLYCDRIAKTFELVDSNGDGGLSQDEFRAFLAEADAKLKALPATAAVAVQQGRYLSRALNRLARHGQPPDPFRYKHAGRPPSYPCLHLGSLAYIGSSSAVADLGEGKFTWGGLLVWWLWRSYYWSEQASLRNRLLLSFDWTRTLVFGRDLCLQDRLSV